MIKNIKLMLTACILFQGAHAFQLPASFSSVKAAAFSPQGAAVGGALLGYKLAGGNFSTTPSFLTVVNTGLIAALGYFSLQFYKRNTSLQRQLTTLQSVEKSQALPAPAPTLALANQLREAQSKVSRLEDSNRTLQVNLGRAQASLTSTESRVRELENCNRRTNEALQDSQQRAAFLENDLLTLRQPAPLPTAVSEIGEQLKAAKRVQCSKAYSDFNTKIEEIMQRYIGHLNGTAPIMVHNHTYHNEDLGESRLDDYEAKQQTKVALIEKQKALQFWGQCSCQDHHKDTLSIAIEQYLTQINQRY